MQIVNRFRRWRHSRGFGIHSPYAFRFVCEVLNPSRTYGFYAYEELEQRLRQLRVRTISRRRLSMLFRVVVELRPATVSIVADGNMAELLRFVVAKASPRAEVVDDRADLLLCASTAVCHDATHAVFFDISNGALDAFAGRAYGHLYRNPDIVIYVGHKHLPRQTFEVKF